MGDVGSGKICGIYFPPKSLVLAAQGMCDVGGFFGGRAAMCSVLALSIGNNQGIRRGLRRYGKFSDIYFPPQLLVPIALVYYPCPDHGDRALAASIMQPRRATTTWPLPRSAADPIQVVNSYFGLDDAASCGDLMY